MSSDQINRGVAFTWFTPTLTIGVLRKLNLSDLPAYPDQFSSEQCKKRFQHNSANKGKPVSRINVSKKGNAHHGYKKLVSAIRRNFGWALFKTGLLKALTCAMSFSGPLLLGYIVAYLEDGVTEGNLLYGLFLVGVLTLCSLISTALNVNYNIRSAVLKINIQATLTRIVFSRSISLTTISWTNLKLSSAQINNLIQVDVEQVSDCVKSIHDLWALPVQIIVAFVLLYLQIKIAFLAGVAVIVIMIPFNAYIAKKIGSNTALLMIEKDARLKVIGEAFRNVCSLKMSGLEGSVLSSSLSYRAKEVHYLAVRKYLDAVCVLLWASMPVVVPFVTFTTVVLVGTPLSASDVITSIALLNMLIFPMNAYPWVINGFMEARVSARRLAHVLLSEDGSTLVVHNRLIDSENNAGGFSTPLVGGSIAVFDAEDVHYAWSSEVDALHSLTMDREEGGWDVETAHRSVGDSGEGGVHSPLVQRESSTGDSRFSVTINDLHCSAGQMWAVVGSTGSGKTALLLGLLGELYRVGGGGGAGCGGEQQRGERGGGASEGDVGAMPDLTRLSTATDTSVSVRYGVPFEQKGFKLDSFHAIPVVLAAVAAPSSSSSSVARTSVAYCAQVPPIHSGSIRSNILMGSEYDAVWYRDVIKGCCLGPDLMAANMTNGDLTDVGVAGSNLSGGQKLRVGIARALYSNHRVVILDDPFSALDAATGEQLMHYLQHTVCQLQGRIVILSTHSISLLREVSGILVMSHGLEVQRGTYSHLQTSCTEFQDLSEHVLHLTGEEEEQVTTPVDDKVLDRCIVKEQAQDVADMIVSKALNDHDSAARAEEEDSAAAAAAGGKKSDGRRSSATSLQQSIEMMSSGKIRSRVYKEYFYSVGICLTIIIVLFTFLMYFTSIVMALWLAYWATHQDDYSNLEFILISSGILVSNLIFALFRSFLFAKGGLNACKSLYLRLTSAVFHADIAFFESTAVGRLTNRFGKDTNVIDDQLPFIMNSLLAQFFMMLGGTFVMAYNDPLIIVFLLIVAVFQYRLQRFYRESSRELRRLDSVYRSPVYTIFTECMQNAVTIRSLGSTCLRFFDQQLSKSLDNSLRVTLSLSIASQWLSTRLQLMGASVNTVLAIMIVLNDLYRVMPVSAGLAGLSLIYGFSIVNNMNSMVNAFAETEQEMISVERVLEYCNLESEFSDDSDNHNDTTEDPRGKTCCGMLCAGIMNSRLPRQGYQSFQGSTVHLVNPVEGSESGEGSSSSSSSAEATLRDTLISSGFGAPSPDSVILSGNLLKNSGILLTDVCMRYPTNAQDTLSHISLHITPGSRVAVTGRTGSGKSSLIRLLLRLNEYHSGSIALGGQELRHLSKQSLRQSIGVIPQNPLVFTGSVRYNLDPFGVFPEEQVLSALDRCRFYETTLASSNNVGTDSALERLPAQQTSGMSSFDSLLNSSTQRPSSHAPQKPKAVALKDLLNYSLLDGGSNLSLGQKQLLCLGRVLLQRAELVLVDEATAAIDPVTEGILYEVLATQLRASGATLLMICHKQNGIEKICNKMLEMKDGRIVCYEDIN